MENLLLIVPYYIHGIAQYISKICLIFKWSPIMHFKLNNYQLMFYFCCGYIIPAGRASLVAVFNIYFAKFKKNQGINDNNSYV